MENILPFPLVYCRFFSIVKSEFLWKLLNFHLVFVIAGTHAHVFTQAKAYMKQLSDFEKAFMQEQTKKAEMAVIYFDSKYDLIAKKKSKISSK
jgi:hypothetical protein